MILTFLLNKSATTNHIYSNTVPNFKLESLLIRILKTKKLDLWMLRSAHSNKPICLGNPVQIG